MPFIIFSIISIFIYTKTENFKLALIIFNIGITWSIINIVFQKDDEEDYIEKEIAKGIKKEVNTKITELSGKVNHLQNDLKLSAANKKKLENELKVLKEHKSTLEIELNESRKDSNNFEQVLKNEIYDLNTTIKNMRKSINSNENKSYITDLKQKLEKKELELSNLKYERIKNQSLQVKVRELSGRIDVLNQELGNKDKKIKQIKSDNKNSQVHSKVNDLREKLKTVNSEGLGRNLESKFRHVLSTFVIDKSASYMDLVGVKKYDNYQGTDFILYHNDDRIRIDITARDSKGKDNMFFLKEYELFKLYMRTGNCVSKFDESVLVYVVPYYEENKIIDAMVEIYNNLENTLTIFKKIQNERE